MDGSGPTPRRGKRDAKEVGPPQADPLEGGDTGGIAAKKLRSFVERIERLETEKADLAADIRDCYQELKGHGFDTKIVKQVIKLRKMEEPDRKEQDELLDLYRAALEI